MSALILKIIACISMFIDHIGYVVFDGSSSWFNYIGRLAFPIFAYQISEGYIHTKNLKKYLLRLFIFALVSQIPFMLFISLITDNLCFNVIFTLFLGLVSIVVYDKYNKFVGITVAIILGIIAQALNLDYGFYGVAIILLFYAFRNNKWLLAGSFVFATLLEYAWYILCFSNYGIEVVTKAFWFYLPLAICTCLSIIVILLYNKKKGPNSKHLFYLFYPLHLLLIYAISLLV